MNGIYLIGILCSFIFEMNGQGIIVGIIDNISGSTRRWAVVELADR